MTIYLICLAFITFFMGIFTGYVASKAEKAELRIKLLELRQAFLELYRQMDKDSLKIIAVILDDIDKRVF